MKSLAAICMAASLLCLPLTAEARNHHRIHRTRIVAAHVHHSKHRHHSKTRKIASVAAPIAVGAAFGPGGSIAYQAVKYRHAIKRGLNHH